MYSHNCLFITIFVVWGHSPVSTASYLCFRGGTFLGGSAFTIPWGDCQGLTPAAWCSSVWCYVDPCECTVDSGIGESDYFSTTATGAKLFYSYKACERYSKYSITESCRFSGTNS